MRKRKLVWNTISALTLQVVTLFCGFVLPRLILSSYGSEVNGMVNSITQFLQVISLMECGMGAVMQSSLYEPLVVRDDNMISCIVTSGKTFFHNVGGVLCIYVFVLLMTYPKLTDQQFGSLYVGSLILIMSVSLFAQYYFGITNQILLSADQRGYVHNIVQMMSIALNTIVCAIMMQKDFSIHAVKLVTATIYLIRPTALCIYVNKHYNIDKKVVYDQEPIRQKWNGVAQHIAAFILDGTDTIVLTVFSSLTVVSVYSVYNMVIFGIKSIFISLSSGIQSVFGEMLTKREIKQLSELFCQIEWMIHTGVTLIFGCTSVLLAPFVQVYTSGIDDAVYKVPGFALLLTFANAMHCLRLPYNIMIRAGGHYKQTQNNYVIAAFINVILSIVLVKHLGLIGVAVGTLAAMSYQTIWMAYYGSKYLIRYPISNFYRQIGVDLLIFTISYGITRFFKMKTATYMAWFLLAVKTSLVWLMAAAIVNILFYKKNVKYMTARITKYCQGLWGLVR
mgnify:FL=1